jgi:hypothetical protein
VALALGLALHAALERTELGLLGAGGAAALGAGLVLRRPGLVAPSVVLVAAGYAGALLVRDAEQLDPAAPLVACALLLLAELAYWSIELAQTARAEGRVLARRAGAVLALAAASLALGAGVLAVTELPFGGGLAWNLVGLAAAAAAVTLIVAAAARADS